MSKYWISWHQAGTDCRPLYYPPGLDVLAWWGSGTTDTGTNMFALVEARTETFAKCAIVADWPEADENWRFCDLKPADFTPGDRFPIEPGTWMHDRVFGSSGHSAAGDRSG